MALLRKCIYAKLLYFEGCTGVVWFQVVFVISNSLVSSLEQIAEYKTVAELPCPASLMTFALSHFPS